MCPFFCSGAKSREHYRDFTEPKKFEGALELVHREADDSIYRVPYRSLAHLVRWEEHLEWPRESKLPRLAPYVAAIDDPSRSQLSTVWLSANQLRITGQVDPETMMGVPVTYDAGWRATQGGRELEIVQDNLGFHAAAGRPGERPDRSHLSRDRRTIPHGRHQRPGLAGRPRFLALAAPDPCPQRLN